MQARKACKCASARAKKDDDVQGKKQTEQVSGAEPSKPSEEDAVSLALMVKQQ